MIADPASSEGPLGALQIRPYEARDRAAVRDLFVRINRELAPAGLRNQFEVYISLALREEIDRIPAYYAADRGASFWVAVDDRGLAGNFGLEPVDAGLELRRMYVDPRYRQKGLGRLMLARAEQIARRQGSAGIVLSTSALQQAALQLYGSAGYRLVREEIATTATNKTVGAGIRRYHFEKRFASSPAEDPFR